MNRVLNGIANNPVGWISNRVATLSESVDGVKNTLSTITSGLLFVKNTPVELIKLVERCEAIILLKDFSVHLKQVVDRIVPVMQDALPSVNGVLTSLEAAKDYLAFLEFFGYIRECGDPDLAKKTFAKQASLACKLGFSSLETIFLIPNKFKWIDLGKFCETLGSYSTYFTYITPMTLKLCSNSLVIASSIFGIWAASEEIGKAKVNMAKNLNRMSSLNELKKQVASSSPQMRQTMATYLRVLTDKEEKVVGAKSDKLVKTYEDILRLRVENMSLKQKISDIADPKAHATSISELSAEIEKNKVDLKAAQEKAMRIVAFYKTATGKDLSQNALRVIKNKFIVDKVKANLNQFQNQSIKANLNELLQEKNYTNRDFSSNLQANIVDFRTIDEVKILNDLKEEADRCINFLVSATTSKKTENAAIEEIVDYKINKMSQAFVANESIISKAKWTQLYELAKISIVGCVTLGVLLIPAGLAPALVINYAAGVATATWGSGLAICLLGGIRTVHTIFFWKDPKKMPRLTTNLGRLAV